MIIVAEYILYKVVDDKTLCILLSSAADIPARLQRSPLLCLSVSASGRSLSPTLLRLLLPMLTATTNTSRFSQPCPCVLTFYIIRIIYSISQGWAGNEPTTC